MTLRNRLASKLLGNRWHVSHSKEEGRGIHGRIFVTDFQGERSARFEYHLPSSSCAVGIASDEERALLLTFCVPPVGLYMSCDSPLLQMLSAFLIARFPDPAGSHYGGRDLSVAIHGNALWWHLWVDRNCWSNARPAWRDGCWHPLGHYKLRGAFEVLEQRDVLVPMPERSYRGTAKVLRSRWGFEKLPALFDKVLTHVSVDMHDGEQIPHPGKGENSYDCGEDATFSTHGPGRTVEDGVGKLVASVLRSRQRHGGPNWTPEPRAAEASA